MIRINHLKKKRLENIVVKLGPTKTPPNSAKHRVDLHILTKKAYKRLRTSKINQKSFE